MYIGILVSRMLQYKYSLFLGIVGQLLFSISGFLGVFFLMERFRTIRGYTLNEVILCYSITLLAYSLSECFFRGFDQFNSLLQSGDFDRFLLRPRSLIIQVLGAKFELSRIGRVLQAVVLIIYVLTTRSTVTLSGAHLLLLVFMVISGVFIFSCLFVIQASLTFYTIENIELFNILTDGIREFGRYPVAIYGKSILAFTTFVIPFALFQYYPFLLLTGRSDNWLLALCPFLSLLFLLPTYWLWQRGVRSYSSTGS